MAVVARRGTKELSVFVLAPGALRAGHAVADGVGDEVIEKVEGAVACDYHLVRVGVENLREKAAALRDSVNNSVVSDVEAIFALKILRFAVYKVEHRRGKRKLLRAGLAPGDVEFKPQRLFFAVSFFKELFFGKELLLRHFTIFFHFNTPLCQNVLYRSYILPV